MALPGSFAPCANAGEMQQSASTAPANLDAKRNMIGPFGHAVPVDAGRAGTTGSAGTAHRPSCDDQRGFAEPLTLRRPGPCSKSQCAMEQMGRIARVRTLWNPPLADPAAAPGADA